MSRFSGLDANAATPADDLAGQADDNDHPAPTPWTGTWCPQCGPDVSCDEDGCCSACGATAVGEGAEQALALRAGVDPTHPAQRAVTSRPAVRGDFSEAEPTDLTTVISAAILVRVAKAAYRRGAEDGRRFAADMTQGIMNQCMSQLAAARTSARRHAVGVLQIAFGRIADDIRALGAGHAKPDWKELIRVALTEDEP